jgi:hypothetical protein
MDKSLFNGAHLHHLQSQCQKAKILSYIATTSFEINSRHNTLIHVTHIEDMLIRNWTRNLFCMFLSNAHMVYTLKGMKRWFVDCFGYVHDQLHPDYF